jgi:selenide,water dikinase
VDLPKEILVEILKGGASKAREAGMLIVGGHTIDDKEPKYGLAITGVIKPGLQVTNAGARPGDNLVLTKPIGTGVITTAGKQQRVEPEVLQGAIDSMGALNRAASEAMLNIGVNACVDVTGFGLIGHLLGMLDASDAAAKVHSGRIPRLAGASRLAEQDIVPGGTRRNLKSADRQVSWHPSMDESEKLLLCDAQTSGGLLIAAPPDKADRLLDELLRARGLQAATVIGEVVAKGSVGKGRIEVLP